MRPGHATVKEAVALLRQKGSWASQSLGDEINPQREFMVHICSYYPNRNYKSKRVYDPNCRGQAGIQRKSWH